MLSSFALGTSRASSWSLSLMTKTSLLGTRVVSPSLFASFATSVHSNNIIASLVASSNNSKACDQSRKLLLPFTSRRSFTELVPNTEELLRKEGVSLEEIKKTLGGTSPLFQPIPEAILPSVREKKNKKEEIVWAVARRHNVRISMKKLVPVANQIRGLNYMEAIAQLKFSPKTVLPPILTALLKQARGNAVDKYNWNPDRLLVDIQVGKGMSGTPRIEFRARGKHGIRRTSFSHIIVRVRPIPVVEGESRVGKAGLTHKSYPEKLLSNSEKKQMIKDYKENQSQEKEARLQRVREEQQKAKEDSRKRAEARAANPPPPEENIIESLIPIRRKITLRDITAKPKHQDVKGLFRELYKDDMDEEWMQKFKSEYMPILSGDRHKQTISLESLKKLPEDIQAARERIKRSKEEYAAEVEKKKKHREEYASTLEKLGEETKQKKAKTKADRDAKKKEDEEKEKALREKLAKLRASKTTKE